MIHADFVTSFQIRLTICLDSPNINPEHIIRKWKDLSKFALHCVLWPWADSLFQTRSLLPSALKPLLSCCQMHNVLWFCFLGFCSGKSSSCQMCTWVLSPHYDWCFSGHRSCLPEVLCPNYKLSLVYPFHFGVFFTILLYYFPSLFVLWQSISFWHWTL